MKLFIVEDDTMLRDSMAILLNGEQNIEVTGAFGNAQEALLALKTQQPDVMLVDLGLPAASDGIGLITEIKLRHPEVECMALTVFEDKQTIFTAIRSGASGYILKGATPRQLIEALHSLHEGGAPMSPKIARALICQFQESTGPESSLLTARETDVLQLLDKGLTYQQIAEKLCISHHTVHSHIKQIYEKLQAKGRRDALTKARKKGVMV